MNRFENYNEQLEKNLKDPKFKKEWDKLEQRYKIISLIINLRNKYNLTQEELAKKLNTSTSVISRIENGSVEISFDFLKRIAKSFNLFLEIDLIEKNIVERKIKKTA